eukprot:TRINITY_DN2793_c0_g1_i1.p1 TRINITY_DN2793_c0_g1~~TRINITY_DN2793_c0_g1_i1.p1  ORF type:complete len:204 (+),score=48.52 TRINITY_DN2793_c0_g1_i1:367-978(+)
MLINTSSHFLRNWEETTIEGSKLKERKNWKSPVIEETTQVCDDNSITHTERCIIKFPKENIFKVVANVDKYKYFVPYVQNSVILSKDFNNDFSEKKKKQFLGKLDVGFRKLNLSYTSLVTVYPYESIKASIPENSSSILEFLVSSWDFKDVPDEENECEINFSVSFKFRSNLIHAIAHEYFEKTQSETFISFIKQCENSNKRK